MLAGLALFLTYLFVINIAESASFPPAKDLPNHPEMPNPLVMQDGKKVTNIKQWRQRRREMEQLMEVYVFGHMPPPPGNVCARVVSSGILMNGGVTCQVVRLTFGRQHQLGFDVRIFSPIPQCNVTARFPTIIHPVYVDTKNLVEYTNALRRGYAVADINYQQLGADGPNYRKSGFFPSYPDCDWNDIAAWAWGISRCVDFLETYPAADKSSLIVLGVSRLGQSAALAGALDERIAMVAQVGGGSAFRFTGKGRGGKQGLDEIERQNTYWFGPGLAEFVGQTDRLPFDYHWLPAMTAPRFYLLCNGLEDQYVNDYAVVQTFLSAKPVYEFLGHPENLGLNFRAGRHGMTAEDWSTVLDFADQKLRGIDHHRRFDQIPPKAQLHQG